MITDRIANDSAHHLSKEYQDTAPNPQFEPFEIVLVDLQNAAIDRKIHCVKKQLKPGVDLEYVAISYRWGEVAEQLVVTPDYDAHIISFNIDDFLDLCEAISKETDFYMMKYVWVDAICVDQVNETRRKETIYHMNEIYEYANCILAVPDLHLDCLDKDPLYEEAIGWISKNAEYVYHIIMNNGNRVEEMDDHWMEKELKVPSYARRLLKSRFSIYFQEHRDKTLLECMRLEVDDPSLDYWYNTILMNDWQHEIDKKYQNLDRALGFLLRRCSDWSSRTWVISEYSIAAKKNGLLKYWFISLSRYWNSIPENSSFRFFTLDISISTKHIDPINARRGLPFTVDNLYQGSDFGRGFNKVFKYTSFLDMLLKSNASKNSDRFYALLPLSEEYRHHIKDENTIKNWKITDMVSVRMRVRQWLKVQENIALLYNLTYQEISFVLPSFDYSHIIAYDISHDLIFGYEPPANIHYNYDLTHPDQPALIIKDKVDEDNTWTPADDQSPIKLRYSMHLYPKLYLARSITLEQDISHIIFDRIWKELHLDFTADPLTWLRIPLFIKFDEENNLTCFDPFSQDMCSHLVTPDCILDLIGCRIKNVWIAINPSSDLLTTEYIHFLDDWTWCQRGADELCIY